MELDMRIITTLCLLATAAHADPCHRGEDSTILLDGILDDWRAVPTPQAGSGDGGFIWGCVYTADKLSLMVDVDDDRLLRTKQGPRSGEDHVVFHFGKATSLSIYPSSTEYGAPLITEFSDGRSTRRVEVHDSLQKKGWSVELGMPLTSVPGWTNGTATIPFSVEVDDADSMVDHKIVHSFTAATSLDFEEGSNVYTQFLTDLKLSPSSITFDQQADLDGDHKLERILVVSCYLAILSDGYTYVELSHDPKDIRDVRVVDLAGDGTKVVLTRYLERGDGGNREVLAIFRVDGSNIDRLFAHELSKEAGASKMTNSYAIVPSKKRGNDLVIKADTVVTGFSKDTWNEDPANDMLPILLPWGPKKQETFHFHAGTFTGDP
jgi:hypothetical protein